ncbi:MAG: 50S ribosomal protein L9 [Desulfatibacillaceae bacterium]
MKVILTETMDNLGAVGTEVDVKPGYARNYLFPKKLALPANDHNLKMLEKKRLQYEEKVARERATAEQLAERVENVTLLVNVRVSEEKRLYGSVNRRTIVDMLAEEGIDVDRSQVRLSEPIKELGTYRVPIKLFQDIEPEITVQVEPEQPSEE